MNYILRKASTRNCLLLRGWSPEGRIVDHKRFDPKSQVAEFDGTTFLITHSQAKIGTGGKVIKPYTGRFPRVVLFIRNLIETVKGIS